jgi:hypothetical protein
MSAKQLIESANRLCGEMSPEVLEIFIKKLKKHLTLEEYKQWLGVLEDYTKQCNTAETSRILVKIANSNNNDDRLKNPKKILKNSSTYLPDIQDRIVEDLEEIGHIPYNEIEEIAKSHGAKLGGGKRYNKTYKRKVNKRRKTKSSKNKRY